MTKMLLMPVLLFLFAFATSNANAQTHTADKLVGTWTWKTIIDPETGSDMGIETLTMGMASEVKTEFKKDNTYVESKIRSGSTEYSTVNGEWKLEENNILSLKAKEKWRPGKLIQLTNDSLLLQMNPKMNLLMLKQK